MFRRFIGDESGMTMGLVVIMMVLIGVMGAGLLTFVRTDLESVVEANKGQKALDVADAGVQAAKAHLRRDSIREHYDTVRSNDCAKGIRVGSSDENWSPATQIWLDNRSCTTSATRSAREAGVTRSFAGGKFRATIQCYTQAGDATPTPCKGSAGSSPEASAQAKDRKFFKITSTGYDTVGGEGAVRKIEAIYYTAKIGSVPTSYFTPKDIDFNGGPKLKRMGFFAGGNVTGTTLGSIAVDRVTEAPHKDWNVAPYNTVPRVRADGTSIDGVGFGALGRVCGGNSCGSDGDSVADGRNDYDRTTGSKSGGQNKRFVFKTDASGDPAPTRALNSNEISFPFDPGNLNDPATILDSDFVEELKKAAEVQDAYKAPSSSVTLGTADWPGQGSIYFVDGQDLTFKVNRTPLAEGILVVRNGNFELNNSSNGFRGIIIVLGNGTTTGNYETVEGTSVDGFALASGTMTIGGDVNPDSSTDYSNLLSLYNVKLWSWRECYDAACNYRS